MQSPIAIAEAHEADIAEAVAVLLRDPESGRRRLTEAFERVTDGFAKAESPMAGIANRLSLDLVTGIGEAQKVTVERVMRHAVMEGMNPNDTAKLIADLVPLTERQAQAVINYRQALKHGVVALPALRDRRTDAMVERGVPAERVEPLVSAYAERLRLYRARTIARTESLRAANLSQHETIRQAVKAGRMPALSKKWLVAFDERTCDICNTIASWSAGGIALDDEFPTPDGSVLVPPAHPNCRCTVQYSLV